LDVLRDPGKRSQHAAVRRALVDMGRAALNPLVAATESKDNDLLVQVIDVLGDIGYPESVPYLARLANSRSVAQPVRSAATQSLMQMGAGDPGGLNASNLFYDLAEKFYHDTASIVADHRTPTAFVWFWDDNRGLMKRSVPAQIFNEIMAMRANEYALKIDPSKAEATSLWLASNYKREAEMPEGGKDETRAQDTPGAHFYGVNAGTQYLNDALSRSLRDYNAAVALRVIKSLQEIVGQSNLFTGQGQPLIDALDYPDRLVRYEAAFALAGALPQQQFPGQDRVVPLLAEALSQTGKANVLVVMPSQDAANAIVDALKSEGFGAVGAANAQGAIAASAQVPSVDVILLTEDLGAGEIGALLNNAQGNPRLARVAKLVITKTASSPYAIQSANDPLMNAVQSSEPAALKAAIESARGRGGSLPLDDEAATSYALRSAELMGKLAISRGQVYDLMTAQSALLAALNDPRADVVKASGNVLGLLNSKESQAGLFTKAQADDTGEDVKVSLFKSLATSAKFFGNQLDGSQVDGLQQTVQEAQNLAVRSSAAEARGALNLPAEQATQLIIAQSKTTLGGNGQTNKQENGE
ncbi:MAG: HEAT repeat domain-containing protein, partial [Tepidisphaeraceae bacterium]